MGLSLNPVDFLKLFSDARKRDKEQIATWLEEAANEARQIADVWLKTRNELVDYEVDSARNSFDSSAANCAYYDRLEESRSFASSVFDGRIDDSWRDRFMNKSGMVMSRRNEVKALYERLYGPGKKLYFIDERSRAQQLDDFESAVLLLNREAAALEVLARSFRASP